MISIKLKLDWGQTLYLHSDPDQFPRSLVGITVVPGDQILYTLSYLGEAIDAYSFEVDEEINQDILLNLPKREDDD